MNTYTFRVPTVSVGGVGGLFTSCVKSLPLMQRLFEEQATLFHLAEHLSLLSLTVNVLNVGKTPPLNSHTASLKPVFPAGGNTPICIVTAVVLGQLVFRESLQQHLQLLNNKLRIIENIPEFCIWVKFLPTWGFGQSILWCLLFQLIIRVYKKTHTVFTEAQL